MTQNTFEELKQKIDLLNTGLLNPANDTSNLSSKQSSDLAVLCLRLDAIVDDLKAAGGTESNMRQALNDVIDIETEAKSIAHDDSVASSESNEGIGCFGWIFIIALVLWLLL